MFFKVLHCALSLFRLELHSVAFIFCWKTAMLHFWTDLLKDTLLRIEEEKKPSARWEQNPETLCCEACALPLC